jgi:hypothetical protein
MSNPFRYFNSSPEVIRLVVMMYVIYRRCATSKSAGETSVRHAHIPPDLLRFVSEERTGEAIRTNHRCSRTRIETQHPVVHRGSPA